jgi:signal transduction histidine kinase
MRDQECFAGTRSDVFASELHAAVVRAAGLRARAGGALGEDGGVFQQTFQELDTAHEELREAEAHLHAQADELASALAELECERTRAREIFEGAPEAYVLSDASGRVVRANRRASDLLRIDPRFLPRKPIISFVERADRARVFELITNTGVGGAPSKADVRLRPRGSQSSVACIASVSRATEHDPESDLRWIFCELPAQTSLQQGEPSECASRETARLLSQVSQELRTNLSSVSGWLHIVRQNMSEHDSGLRAIGSVMRAVRTTIGIADRLAEYARLERDEVPLACEPIALIEMVGQLIEETRVTALQRGIRLSALLRSGVPAIVGDPVQLQRALQRLLFDVARSTAPGGELYIAVSPSGGAALITIRSTGCGIDQTLLRSSETGPSCALDTEIARARRCLELHGATIQTETAGPDGHSSIAISFPHLVVKSASINGARPGLSR